MQQYTVFRAVLHLIVVIDVIHACTPIRETFPNHLQIRSPIFGSQRTYPPNSNCQWDIRVPHGQRAKLSFMMFDLEYLPGCKWDGVEIFHGTCSQTGQSLLRHCGVISPRPVTIDSAVCLRFWSDDVGNKHGFLLSIFILKGENTPVMELKSTPSQHSQLPTYLKTTGHLFRATTVPPPGEMEIHGRKLQMMPITTKQILKEDLFLTSAISSQGTLSYEDTSTTYNTYQVTTKATTVPTSMNTLQLTSASQVKAPGNSDVAGCSPDGVVVSDKKGVIQSPNFGVGNYPLETKCVWKIRASAGERIHISYTNFQLEWERNCRWDSLTAHAGENTNRSSLLGRFCGSDLPSNITSSGNVITLVFVSDRVVSRRGFRLEYDILRAKQSAPACGFLGSKRPEVNYYIFGGTLARAGEVPWQVSVRRDGQHICGGTVLSVDWIMTAAHCVDMIQLSPFRITVLVGSSFISGGSKFSQILQASELLIHPTYRYAKSGDVALIRLLKPIIFSDFVLPICLPVQSNATSWKNCYIAGWGATERTSDGEYKMPSAELLKADVKVWPRGDCDAAYPGRISPHMFCAGHRHGKMDSCKGDSGGALICRGESDTWQAEGVISWGGQCGQPGQPGVYTKLRHYVTWIRDVITPSLPKIDCSFDDSMCGYQDVSRGALSWRRRNAKFPISGFTSISSLKDTCNRAHADISETRRQIQTLVAHWSVSA
ncbi:uncharacterized protein LOC135476179 isoform X2 [Liolophura sinensis]|uniref:uncharacterized protein LOC135476179 isoform X2 n=1 Tax=Liolophura sinensis TaxID=3198878 RepID=UPI003158B77B